MANTRNFDSASCLPAGLLPQLDRRDGFYAMSAVPIVAAVAVLATGATIPASILTVVTALVVASYTDICHSKIYNWTTYPTLQAGVAFACLVSATRQLGHVPDWLGSIGLGSAIAGTLVCGTITFVAYLTSRGGAGDVKLAAGIGCLLGPETGLTIVAATYILAALFVLMTSFCSGRAGPLIVGLLRASSNRFFPLCPPASSEQETELTKTIPLAGFFCMSTFIVLAFS
ncbi:MAG: hypothetical protein Aurels2KO_03700 [Aureliella sp.]